MSVRYQVDVVGTRFAERFKDENEWTSYLAKAWNAIGTMAVQNIQQEIGAVSWLRPTGRLARAVAWEAEDYTMVVYMDSAVAPHAIYQEMGVRRHTMRYLLTATSPIPISTGERSGSGYAKTVFRRATERWMGVPHPYEDQRGQTRQATGWVHPGYEGKKFFRKGIMTTMEEATKRLKMLVFHLSEVTGEE